MAFLDHLHVRDHEHASHANQQSQRDIAPSIGKSTLVEQSGGEVGAAPGNYGKSIFSQFASPDREDVGADDSFDSTYESIMSEPADTSDDTNAVQEIAKQGIGGAGEALPFMQQIQQAFGEYDVGSVRAHHGGDGALAANALGASAFAFGNNIVFNGATDLHTAAHEAAHVMQQRSGVQLDGGMDKQDDQHERQADAIADAVVAGRSAVPMLQQMIGAPGAMQVQAPMVQRKGGGVVYDCYQLLNDAMSSIPSNQGENNVRNWASRIQGELQQRKLASGWVLAALFQIRGTVQNVPGDQARFIGNMKTAMRSRALGPRGYQLLVDRINNLSAAYRPQTGGPCVDTSGPFGRFKTAPKTSITQLNDQPLSSFVVSGNQRATKTTPKQAEPEKKASPQLEMAIKIAKGASKIPLGGAYKESVSAVVEALELAKTAQEGGDASKYAEGVAKLGEAVFKAVGEIVKAGGKNAELAEKACEQLGAVGKVFGHIGKGFFVLNKLTVVLTGKTVGGKVVKTGERVDAGIELITTFTGPIGRAAAISLEAYKWMWNNIGVPILDAVEQIDENDIRHVMNDKSPEMLKAELYSLPTEPEYANRTIIRIYGETFTRSSMLGGNQYSIKEQWELFRKSRVARYQADINEIYKEDSWLANKPAKQTKRSRTEIAQQLQRIACVFIDIEAAKARKHHIKRPE